LNFLSIQPQVAVTPDATAGAAGPPVPKPPSDINLGFNALDASHRLIESIDQSQFKIEDDPTDDSRFYKRQRVVRHVDFPVVAAVLSNLTANQVKQVEDEYMAYEHRPLQYDLFGGGESHIWTDLTVDQISRLKALLAGTRASSEEDAEAAAQHQREGDVAELHAILHGSLGAPEIERVMTLLRRPAAEATALMNEYDLNYDLRSDLFRMGISNAIRAMMLLSGSSIAADAYAIAMARNRIIAIDEALKALSPTDLTATNALIILSQVSTPSGAIERRRQIEALTAERKAQVQIIEDRVQEAAGEAAKEAEGEGKDALDRDTAIRTRVSSVLGAEGATEAVVGGTSAKFIRAVATNEPAELVAAQLRKLEEAGNLTTEAMTDAFRRLRMQAAEEVQRRYPDATVDELKEEERKLSDQWFIHLRSTWDAEVFGEGRKFDEILDRGDRIDVGLKRDLYMASGQLGDADELVLALAGDRKDMETVKRILRGKNANQIAELKRQYQRKTIQLPYWPLGRSLDFDLFGTAPTKAGEENPKVYPGDYYIKPQGKASGTDRLLLEDYMQRPTQEGGVEEVTYIWSRAEREYEYTIDNRGATGWWRDHWGNEARSLLDATIKEVRLLYIQYMRLIEYGANTEAIRSREAYEIIHRMHLARATIRGDRAGYERATAELRATFQAVASFVLQSVLTAVLTPFATALFAARLAQAGAQAGAMAVKFATWTKNVAVGMASTIAANKTVYGNDYNTDMLLHDLKGGLGSAIGATGVGRLLGPVTQRLTARLGKTMAGEVIAGAATLGGMEATAVLEGEPANIFENFLKQHFLGKLGEGITHTTKKVFRIGSTTGMHGSVTEESPARVSGTGTEHEVGPARGTVTESADVDVDVPEEPPRVSMTLPAPGPVATLRDREMPASQAIGKTDVDLDSPKDAPPKSSSALPPVGKPPELEPGGGSPLGGESPIDMRGVVTDKGIMIRPAETPVSPTRQEVTTPPPVHEPVPPSPAAETTQPAATPVHEPEPPPPAPQPMPAAAVEPEPVLRPDPPIHKLLESGGDRFRLQSKESLTEYRDRLKGLRAEVEARGDVDAWIQYEDLMARLDEDVATVGELRKQLAAAEARYRKVDEAVTAGRRGMRDLSARRPKLPGEELASTKLRDKISKEISLLKRDINALETRKNPEVATTDQEHEKFVARRLRDTYPAPDIGDQVILKVTNTVTNDTVEIRIDNTVRVGENSYILVDAKFSEAADLATASLSKLKGTLTENQSPALDWIANGQARVVPQGPNARRAGMNGPIRVVQVQLHVNTRTGIVVRRYW
jgi:hypothetical protein